MVKRHTRRQIIAACGATIATPALADKTRNSWQSYRGDVVIDGNLVAELLTTGSVVDAKTASAVRASGLTAFKQSLGGSSENAQDTTEEIEETKAALSRNASLFLEVRDFADIDLAKQTDRVGMILSFESANMHEGRIESIDHFRSLGVRVMGLSYNIGSPFGTGILSKGPVGLSPLGRQAIERMNAIGVTVDLSHSDEPTSFQALTVSNRPLSITHAGCAAVHKHPRNKSDRLLRAVAENGGVVGIYELSFLGNYPNNPTVDIYMDHLIHALNVCGEEHVGIGSDTSLLSVDTSPKAIADWNKNQAFRKASGVMTPEEGPMPYVEGLNGPFRWKKIAAQLVQRRYKSRTVDAVLGRNFHRVFRETW